MAYQEWLDAPCGLLEDIILFRAYRKAKEVWENSTDEKTLPKSPLIQLAKEIDFAIVQEKRDGRTSD